MSLASNFSGYFSKGTRRDVGELYRASAVSNFAMSLVSIFEPIFLYSVLHYTVPQVLLFMAVVYMVYLPGIIFGGKIASRYGYRHSIALSVPFQVFYWLALVASVNYPMIAFLAAVMLGIQKSFYWPGFHSVIARYAQSGRVGREFGAAYAINNLSQIGGPLLGGIIAQYAGMPIAFFSAAVIYCFSIIPLLSSREIFTPKDYDYSQTFAFFHQFTGRFCAYLGFGEELLALTIWPIFIYTVTKDYKDTGLLAGGASLLAAVLAVILGQLSDQHTKHRLIKVGTFFNSLFWLMKIGAYNFFTTFTMDTAGKSAKETLFVPLSTLTYMRAEETHVVPYAVFFEQSLAVGKLTASLLGIVLFSLTGHFVILFVLGALFSLLYLNV